MEIAKRNFMDVEIEVFWNGESLADAVAQGTYFDMIYLDIEMDKRRWDFRQLKELELMIKTHLLLCHKS